MSHQKADLQVVYVPCSSERHDNQNFTEQSFNHAPQVPIEFCSSGDPFQPLYLETSVHETAPETSKRKKTKVGAIEDSVVLVVPILRNDQVEQV